MRTARLFLVVASVLLLSGCAMFGLRRPTVDLVDVRVARVGLLETALIVDLRVTNHNTVGLTVEDGHYQLFVEGSHVGQGRLTQPLVIPRRGSLNHQVTLHLDNLMLIQQLRSALTTGSFDYRLEAQHFVRGFGSRAFTSVREGNLRLRRDAQGELEVIAFSVE